MKHVLLGLFLGVLIVLAPFVALCASRSVRVHWTPAEHTIHVNHHLIRVSRS